MVKEINTKALEWNQHWLSVGNQLSTHTSSQWCHLTSSSAPVVTSYSMFFGGYVLKQLLLWLRTVFFPSRPVSVCWTETLTENNKNKNHFTCTLITAITIKKLQRHVVCTGNKWNYLTPSEILVIFQKIKQNAGLGFCWFAAHHHSPPFPWVLMDHSLTCNSEAECDAHCAPRWRLERRRICILCHSIIPVRLPLKKKKSHVQHIFKRCGKLNASLKLGLWSTPPSFFLFSSSLSGTPFFPWHPLSLCATQFLAVALLAVSPICFHSLGQDSLLCSSDTFSHRAAQCN